MTVTIYRTTSCPSSRKAELWLNRHKIKHNIRNINKNPLSKDEIIKLVSFCDNGFFDLISKKSETFTQVNKKYHFENLTFSEAVSVIYCNQKLLRKPIIFDDKNILIGYNDDLIRTFIPRSNRNIKLQEQNNY